MIEEIRFHPIAELELSEATEYYETEVNGLGRAFLAEIERALQQIQIQPESSPVILKSIRRKTLHKFPYNILYSISQNTIFILAIANQKRRPFYWRTRK